MIEYPKIETLFDRGDNFKIDTSRLRRPEFGIIDRWLVTEKIDGTNVRIGLHVYRDDEQLMQVGYNVQGRTDRAQFAPDQLHFLEGLLTDELVLAAFDPGETVDELGAFGATIYGELYGPKVQSGGWYRSDLGFRVFDVRVGEWWLDWANVEDVATKLGLRTVPVLGPLDRKVPFESMVPGGYVDLLSRVAREEGGDDMHLHEGIVARTDPLLFDKRGRRVMWKLKVKDFA